MSYSREDVEVHADRGDARPAVNIKVYRSVWDDDLWADFDKSRVADDLADRRFSEEWIREHVTDSYLDAVFWATCGFEFEMIQQDAAEIFGRHVRVFQEGRSGGWAVVDGLRDLEEWDAVMLAKWRKFERYAKLIAADVPSQMLGSLYMNEFAAWADEQQDESVANAELPVDLRLVSA